MKKKGVSLLLALMIGMMSLAGCGNNTSQPAPPEQNKEEAAEPEKTPASEAAEPAAETEGETENADQASVGSTDTETAAPVEAGEIKAEYDPNADFDKYVLVDYTVEDIDAHFVATVSAKEDGSEYEIRCNIDGEEQTVTLDKDLNIISDQTGNMSYDAPIIVQKAIDAGNWNEIRE